LEMKVLIVGSGGREHVLAWKSARSPHVDAVYVAPGNAGTAVEQKVTNVDIAVSDTQALIDFAKSEHIELTIIGPEAPLVSGICDRFREAGLACFGPSAKAAQLEGSKTYAKEFLARHKIPNASYQSFTELDAAINYLDHGLFPVVIKADGLAAGKGVVIATDRNQAEAAIREMLADHAFGAAGSKVVIEEYLTGQEVSFICVVDGRDILPMASSQDHKAAYDGDIGPNTGGMGAYSPSPIVDSAMMQRIMNLVMIPTVNGMVDEGVPFSGFLYAGLMIGADGIPRVIEFNCRFGDPEAQPVLTRLQSDLVEHCLAAIEGKLNSQVARWDSRPCLGVVMAADGYPGGYENGFAISGLDRLQDNTRVFHAGTAIDRGKVVTSGGRVLCITAIGDTIADAQKAAYQRAEQIHWSGAWYRSDIGYRAVGL
jgi:phosphoribosylamine--glycine ligase